MYPFCIILYKEWLYVCKYPVISEIILAETIDTKYCA